MKATDRAYLSKVASLGCMICKMPPEIHHIRSGMGLGMRNTNFNVIPLCHKHHRTGGHGIALHAGKKAFEANYGTELELLEKMKGLM